MGEGNNGGGQNGAPGGNGGTGWMGGTTPGGRSTVAPGAVNSFAAQAVNAKYGYPNSSLDDAVLNGIDTLFNQRYKPAQEFKGHPELQQQFYNDYKDQMLRGLHTRPGGAIDPQLAARVLFPGQDEQQVNSPTPLGRMCSSPSFSTAISKTVSPPEMGHSIPPDR